MKITLNFKRPTHLNTQVCTIADSSSSESSDEEEEEGKMMNQTPTVILKMIQNSQTQYESGIWRPKSQEWLIAWRLWWIRSSSCWTASGSNDFKTSSDWNFNERIHWTDSRTSQVDPERTRTDWTSSERSSLTWLSQTTDVRWWIRVGDISQSDLNLQTIIITGVNSRLEVMLKQHFEGKQPKSWWRQTTTSSHWKISWTL